MKIYNTLTRQKEDFIPITPGEVKLYACGPTVYNYFHIGNARPFIFFDTVRRYFEYRNYKVTYAQNITDIDDKIIAKAQSEQTDAEKIARTYTVAFFEDCAKLGIGKPDHSPKATEYIEKMIALIRELEEKGFAYESNGDVYFSVEKYAAYGKLSGKKIEDLQVGARVAENEQKTNALDFTLWKKAKVGEPKWDSPWGYGRPGWHTECVVMSRELLGTTFDIHGGGTDLTFPHHENEIAQAESQNGKPLANYWMHNGFLNIEGEKMSKSLNNFFTAREILEKYDGETVRFFFLTKHYRSPIDFSEELMKEAKQALERFYNTLSMINYAEHLDESYNFLLADNVFCPAEDVNFDENDDWQSLHKIMEQEFRDAMEDDFNTAKAVAVLFAVNRLITNDKVHLENKINYAHLLVKLGNILGLFTNLPKRLRPQVAALSEDLILLLIGYRQFFKQEKNFAMADKVRNDLKLLGIELKDTQTDTLWEYKK